MGLPFRQCDPGGAVKVIDIPTWPRREHYAKFGAFRYPHFSMCAPVDLSVLRPAVREHGASLTAAILYVVTRVANEITEFRYRIRGETVVEHEVVHPSLTVLVEGDLFGFAHVDYIEDFWSFAARVTERFTRAREEPTLADAPGRDDVLFMTAIPWVSFTSFSHPMPTLPADSIPRFAWGKACEQGGLIKMPLSVQGHHGLLDGIHLGRYYERVERYLREPAVFLGGRG
jgi:chloramphenicol O-acetyltransferase type A